MFKVLAQQEPHMKIQSKLAQDQDEGSHLTSHRHWSDFTSIMNQCCAFDPNYRPSIEQVLQKLEQIPL